MRTLYPLTPGNLRQRISIQTPGSTQSGYGDESGSFATNFSCWASIEPFQGREYFANQQVQGLGSHRIKMWYRKLTTGADINTKCRILFGTRTFNIQSIINPQERNIYLEIIAVEKDR